MALHEFVIELMERILADPELNITENDIRYFDAGVKLDNSEFQWDEAAPLAKNPTIVKSNSLIVRIAHLQERRHGRGLQPLCQQL